MKAAPVPNTTGFDPVRMIETHQAGIWRYLRAIGCEAALAEDLTQETFLAVLQHPFQELSTAATAAYLRKTAHNLFVSHCRRAGRVLALEDIDSLDRNWARWAGDDNGEELLDALRECLRGLGERARRALDLRFRDRQSRATIAAELELTEDGAKNLMQRAKHKLRECIDSKLK
jgi:RNA polymerase sigma-70 factor (ECF subfamily)